MGFLKDLAQGIAGAAPIVGPVVGGLFGAASAEDVNRSNIRLAREQMAFQEGQTARQMEFQERMSSTAHQRETKDLIASGLNPMLAFAKGSAGASTPPGAAGTGQTAHVTRSKWDAIGSALNVAMQQAQIRNVEASTAKTVAETKTEDELRGERLNEVQARAANLTSETTNRNFLRELTAQHLSMQAFRDLMSAFESMDRASLIRAQEILVKLQEAVYRKDSDFAKTWVGKNIAPLLRALSPVIQKF